MENIESTIEFMTGTFGKPNFTPEPGTTFRQRQMEDLETCIDKARCPGSFFWATACRDEAHRKAQAEHDHAHTQKVGYII